MALMEDAHERARRAVLCEMRRASCSAEEAKTRLTARWKTYTELSYRERRILEMRDEERGLEEIAASFNVQPNRIRQMENQAHKKLAHLAKSRGSS